MNAATMVAVAWPVGVLAAGWCWRPRRMPTLEPFEPDRGGSAPSLCSSDQKTGGPAHRTVHVLGAAVEPVGRVLRRAARRHPDRPADQRAGLALLVAGLLAAASPLLVVLVPPVWWALPRLRRRHFVRVADAAVQDEMPLAADLFVLAAGAGLTVSLAVAAVAHRTTGPLGEAFGEAERRTRLGQHPADALAAVVDDAGEALRPLVTVLVAAERYGTPLVGPLERVADDVKRQHRRHAEEMARRVPVKLLFPLVLCTLPAFALLTVVPLLVSALGGLQI